MKNEIDWIPISLSKGMFSNEYAVTLDGVKDKLSLYVDKDMVKEEKGKAFLKVIVIRKDDKEKKRVVLLPSETFETSSRWVNLSL